MKRAIESSSFPGGHFSDERVSLRSILALAMNHAESATPLPPLPASLDHDRSLSPSIFNLIGRPIENESTQLYDFFPKVSGDSSPPSMMMFSKLPDLNSLEHSDLAGLESDTLESVVRSSLRLSAGGFSSDLAGPSPPASPPASWQSVAARNRRRKVTEKMRSLQKLLPLRKKMEAARMLEEVLKYVKFLQSQVVALRSMPSESSLFFDPPPVVSGRSSGDFWRPEEVSRQKLLEILVNSPEIQSVLYSCELCVFSAEQILAVETSASPSQLVARSVPYNHYRY